MDDSGVVDDHDGDDVTSAEEHERRDQQQQQQHPHHPQREHRLQERHHLDKRKHLQQAQLQQERGQDFPPSAPVTVSVRTSNREIRVLKCNGIKSKKHNIYSLPPEYLSHIVVLGEYM